MRKLYLLLLAAILTACTTLTKQEQDNLHILQANGITVDKPIGNFERPANPAGAAALNLLPGGGDFYLASGNAGDSSYWLYGFLNLLTWPFSIIWGVPEAAIDAGTINKRELVYYYQFNPMGKKELAKANISLTN